MDWEKFALNFGLPGLMLLLAYGLGKLWISSNERIQGDRIKVEDKKADATVAALTSLSGKIDSHHTTDIQSHSELAGDIRELHGKIDQALIDRTPVEPERIPPRRETPSRGITADAGYYPPGRPKTQGGR